MRATLFILIMLCLSGCTTYRQEVPVGYCLVTVRHSGPWCRPVHTSGYGVRHGRYVRVHRELSTIAFTRTMRAIEPGKWSAILDKRNAVHEGDYSLIPIYAER